jgi:hypothetical protein
MIAGLALIKQGRQDGVVTSFIIFIAIALGVGLLSLRYGVDSRTGKRQL